MEMIHIEVRKKIIKARKKGIRVAEICAAYDVGKTAVYDLLKREAETGDINPQTNKCGRKFTLSESELTAIDQFIQKQKDITLAEIKEVLSLGVCISTISWAVRNKLGYRYKSCKRTRAPRCSRQAGRMEKDPTGYGYRQTGIFG